MLWRRGLLVCELFLHAQSVIYDASTFLNDFPDPLYMKVPLLDGLPAHLISSGAQAVLQELWIALPRCWERNFVLQRPLR